MIKEIIVGFCLLPSLVSMNAGAQKLTTLRTIDKYSTSVNAVALVTGSNNSLPPAPPSCNPMPTQDQINAAQWTYEEHMYSLSEAISLNIPIVNATGSTSLKIYGKDYKRQSPACSGSDGSQLYYGQIIRTVIEIENYDASLGVNLSAFAASATLGKTTQHFYFYKDGFYNAQVDQILSTIAGKDFNVENYYTFQQVLPQIQALLVSPDTRFAPAIVQIDNQADVEKKKILNSSFIVYAVQNIINKSSYTAAASKYLTNNDALAAIGEVYDYFGISKDNTAPTQIQNLQAAAFMNGLKMKW